MSASNGVQVIICDDSVHVRNALTHALEAEGFSVAAAVSTFRELRTAVLENTPADVILCDVYLSDLSGLEAPRALQELGATTPVLLMSADHRLRPQAKRAGAAGFFVKGRFDLEQLVSVLEDLSGTCPPNGNGVRKGPKGPQAG